MRSLDATLPTTWVESAGARAILLSVEIGTPSHRQPARDRQDSCDRFLVYPSPLVRVWSSTYSTNILATMTTTTGHRIGLRLPATNHSGGLPDLRGMSRFCR